MAYVTYEYNVERIYAWREKNKDAYNEMMRNTMRNVYKRKKDPYEMEAHRLRRIFNGCVYN